MPESAEENRFRTRKCNIEEEDVRKFTDFLKGGRKCALRGLPTITLSVLKKEYFKVFTAPNPYVTETIHNSEREVVGSTLYGVSPLTDRLYLFKLEILPPYRRKGYGLALLTSLAKTYRLPITVVQPISPAILFWDSARKELADAVPMTQSLSGNEMDEEKVRWSHLKPKIDQLERAILERHLRGEPYALAVGRGLDE
ncbi:GNAT family N-acetyltransferase [Massilia scottii]|uniref:GNAT family N-acetyltransferase n=1 Tax=Massilia scottii TaxID=3057166 RepID=UPI0035B4FEA9